MVLGVPAGFLGAVAHEAVLHPALRWMLANHPLVTAPALLGGGALAGLARLGGVALLRDSVVLHAWIVGSACAIFLWSDRPTETVAR